jgi:hypothetical protein
MSNIFEIIDRVDPLSLRGMQRRNNPESRVYLDCFVAVLPTMTMRWEKTYHKDTAKSVTANTRFVPQLKRRDDACRKTGTKSVVQQVSRLSGSPKDFNVNNPEQTKCSSGTATVSTPKKLNCFAVLMMRATVPRAAPVGLLGVIGYAELKFHI